MLVLRTLGWINLALASFGAPLLAADNLGVSVPPGFEVSLFADDELAHDIYAMTVDSQGRVVVSGAGYVKILHDNDNDGRADRATLFSPLPASGAHGMVFDGVDLICTGDNTVMRLRDADADGVADGPGEAWTSLKISEHGANGLVRGPDGCYYLIAGNDAGISEKQITAAHSPVKQPRCGGVVRFSPEGKPLDVVAHGFRNPYDLDFDAAGHLFTVDSDGERDHHLPWYAPTRLFDIAQGMEHGWLLQGHARGWNRPQSFFDSVDRMVEIGRGSPTGLVVYRHRSFPEHYRGGVFSACWTLGRVYYFPLEPSGATCRSRLEIFMQTTGDVGFAPCDLAVGPSGDLFVAIGGRRTRGGVFRVRAVNAKVGESANDDPLSQVLAADQPLSSWSRARWVPLAKQLGPAPFQQAAVNEQLPTAERVRAIEILVEFFGGLDAETAALAAQAKVPVVRARVAWALGRAAVTPDAQQLAARLTADAEGAVARASWESLVLLGPLDTSLPVKPAWSTALNSPQRRVRAAAIAVARDAAQASYREFLAADQSGKSQPAERLARLWIEAVSDAPAERQLFTANNFRVASECFAAATNPVQQLEAVRLLQIGLGDLQVAPGKAEVYTGYAGRVASQLDDATRSQLVRQLAPAFPTADAELNRELARLLGMLGAEHDGLYTAIARQWTADSLVENDIHYLIVASLLRGPRDSAATAATAECLLALHAKMDTAGHFASRNWPERVGEIYAQLRQRDPALADAVVNNPHLSHVEHTLFLADLDKEARHRATRKLWAETVGKGAEPTPELIALVGRLPADEAQPLVRSQWDQMGLRDAIVMVLAKSPREEDRGRFLDALASPQAGVVEKAAVALTGLTINYSPQEMILALRALKQACATPDQLQPRDVLIRLLEYWTEGMADVDDALDTARAWMPWYKIFTEYYPQEAIELNKSSAAGAENWKQRLAGIDFSAGDAQRGRAVFERRACHRCHQANGHLGPELKGAVSRLSRDDLFAAIVDPNLEVSPAFKTTVVATRGGQVYHGLIVYESPEGLLLQTSPDTTVRITDAEQSSVRKSMQSLMPTGLLDPLSDGELGDLYSYLRTLGGQ